MGISLFKDTSLAKKYNFLIRFFIDVSQIVLKMPYINCNVEESF